MKASAERKTTERAAPDNLSIGIPAYGSARRYHALMVVCVVQEVYGNSTHWERRGLQSFLRQGRVEGVVEGSGLGGAGRLAAHSIAWDPMLQHGGEPQKVTAPQPMLKASQVAAEVIRSGRHTNNSER